MFGPLSLLVQSMTTGLRLSWLHLPSYLLKNKGRFAHPPSAFGMILTNEKPLTPSNRLVFPFHVKLGMPDDTRNLHIRFSHRGRF